MAITSSGWSGYWNGLFSANYSSQQVYSNTDIRLNKVLSGGYGGRRLKAVLRSITGAASGSSKALTYKRVAHTPNPGGLVSGGVATIETKNFATGNSTDADVTRLRAVQDEVYKPTTYPADKSGVRSGGRAGSII